MIQVMLVEYSTKEIHRTHCNGLWFLLASNSCNTHLLPPLLSTLLSSWTCVMMKLDRQSSDIDIFGLFRSSSHKEEDAKGSSGESDEEQRASRPSSPDNNPPDAEYHLEEDHSLQGYIKKRSFLGSWKKYYFVLNAPTMEILYYKSRRGYWKKEKPAGSIDLEGASAKMCHLNEKANMFVIFYPDEGTNEVLYLWPASEAERKTWVGAINKLTNFHDSLSPLSTSTNGSPCNSLPTSPVSSAPPSPRATR